MVVATADRVTLVTRAIWASLAGDASAVEELFAADVLGSSPAMSFSSREELALELEEWKGALSDLRIDVDALEVRGDRCCVEWVASARHTGPLDAERVGRVLEPTGRPVVVFGVTVAEFSGSRISAFRHYWDDRAVLKALGLGDPR